MPEVTRDQALELLANEVRRFAPDELVEVYNEFFPKDRRTVEEAYRDPAALARQVIDHINGIPEMDQLTEVWSWIFTRHRNIWYNDEDDLIHYNEPDEPYLTE